MAELTPSLFAGLRHVRGHGGAVVRSASGVWVHPGAGAFETGMGHLAPRVVYALARRGFLEIRWIGKDGRATLTQAGIAATNDPLAACPPPMQPPSRLTAALVLLESVQRALHAANETPNGPITDTIWLLDSPCTAFDALEEAIDHIKSVPQPEGLTHLPCARCGSPPAEAALPT